LVTWWLNLNNFADIDTNNIQKLHYNFHNYHNLRSWELRSKKQKERKRKKLNESNYFVDTHH